MNRQRISKRPLPPRKLPPECLGCGEVNPWVVKKVDFTAPFRDVEHLFRAEVNQCRRCDAISTTEDQSAVISAQVRDIHRKWISEQLKKAQRELGLSLRELSEKTGIPFATLGRISAGDHLIEATTEKMLWMEIGKLSHVRVMERWLQMEQPTFRVTNGSVRIEADPEKACVYSKFLKTETQFPMGSGRDYAREGRLSKQCYNNLVLA